MIIEKPGGLFQHHFWLLTSCPRSADAGRRPLGLYPQRGATEAGFDGFVNCLDPALSCASRPKSHYRGKSPRHASNPCNAFGHNEAILLLHALAYKLAHTSRLLMEKATGQGLHLTWEDVGPDWMVLRIRKTTRGYRLPRRVPIAPELAASLEALRAADADGGRFFFRQADQDAPHHMCGHASSTKPHADRRGCVLTLWAATGTIMQWSIIGGRGTCWRFRSAWSTRTSRPRSITCDSSWPAEITP